MLDQSEAYAWTSIILSNLSGTLKIENLREQSEIAWKLSSWVEPLHESYAGSIQ